jgi:L-lactate dehydrogenase complex protein LldG
MEESTSREKILKKIRAALIHKSRVELPPVDFESPLYPEAEDSLELVFAQQFTDLGGQFIFCENEEDFVYNLNALIADDGFGKIWCTETAIHPLIKQAGISFKSKEADLVQSDTSITSCELLVARTGSILVSSAQQAGRRGFVFPHQHIVVARTSQLVHTLEEAMQQLKEKYQEKMPSMISMITGASRTADIEKTLVYGAHGPKEIYLFLIDDIPVN